jgi:hypothetical protein
MPFPLLSVFDIGSKLIDRLLPDPAQKAQAQLELLKLHQSGQLQEMDSEVKLQLAQIDVDKTEVAMTGYKGAWRPTVGYICCIGLLYQFLVQPLAAWISGIEHWAVPPVLDMGSLLTLLTGMLGLGGMRTFEKIQEKE